MSDPFFEYDRPATYEVMHDQVGVPVRDGSEIACDIYRPETNDPVPGIVYEYTAYADSAEEFAEDATFFVERGYSALICQARGSGDSPGELDPFSPQEQEDNYDVIEWLAEQEFSSGKVGQMGMSYGGHTSLLVAVNQPPSLEAILPINGLSDWYQNTIYRGGNYSPRIRQWQEAVAPVTLDTYAENPTYNNFWEGRSVSSRYENLNIPVLQINGWYDRYRGGMVENFQARPENVWLVSGPWEHGYPEDQPEDIGLGAYLAWWDRWLLDDPGAPLPEAQVTSFEIPEGNDNAGWDQFDQWPPSTASRDRFWLNGDDTLGSTPDAADEEVFTVNTEDEEGQAEHSAEFSTAPLEEDLVIAGTLQVNLAVEFTAEDGTIAIVVQEVDEQGNATRITEGWLKASHRLGSDREAEVVPETLYQLTVDTWPTHYRVNAGHQLEIRVSSDDYPEIESSSPAGEVTVHTGENGSSMVVPTLD